MKKWIALLLCLTMMLGLSATALAEGEKTESEKDAEQFFEDKVQDLLGRTAEMSDDEIRQEFRKIAEESDIKITDKQLDRLVKVCRTLETLNSEDLGERIELMTENFYEGLLEAPDKFMGWLEDVGSGKYTLEDAKNGLLGVLGKAAGALSSLFGGIEDFFSGLVTGRA